jgi:VanZ family protein
MTAPRDAPRTLPADERDLARRPTAWRRWFWAYLAAWTLVLLMPSPERMPIIGEAVARLAPADRLPWDKLGHVSGYLVFGLLGCAGTASRTRAARGSILALGITHGALTEILQWLSGLRHGEVNDWLADAAGVALGVLLVRVPMGGGGRSAVP